MCCMWMFSIAAGVLIVGRLLSEWFCATIFCKGKSVECGGLGWMMGWDGVAEIRRGMMGWGGVDGQEEGRREEGGVRSRDGMGWGGREEGRGGGGERRGGEEGGGERMGCYA